MEWPQRICCRHNAPIVNNFVAYKHAHIVAAGSVVACPAPGYKPQTYCMSVKISHNKTEAECAIKTLVIAVVR